MLVEGAIAVKAALNSKYRKVTKIYLEEGKKSHDITYILQSASKANICVERCNSDKIQELAKGKTHGGVLAEVSERKFQSVISLLKKEKPFLVYLEGVEDSYNLGYILRSLYAFGCDGVILPKRNWHFEDDVLIKSSAGASELIPIHLTSEVSETLSLLKENGFKVVSAYRGNNATSLYQTSLAESSLLLCIGGPLRGLTKSVLEASDEFVYIPYANDFKMALNSASAAVVLASEVYRQKSLGDE